MTSLLWNWMRRRAGRTLLAAAVACCLGSSVVSAQTSSDSPAGASDSASVVSEPEPASPPASRSTPASTKVEPAPSTRRVRLDQSAHNVIRSGPGQDYAIVGVYPKDTIFPVIAKSGDWYNVRVSDSETGWIHSSLCRAFDDMSALEFRPNPKLYSRTGSMVVNGYAGGYAFDRKSNSLVLGGRIGYYVFERLQAEGGMAWTHVRRPAEIVESLFGLTLEEEDFHMLFYHLNLTWELMPGRQMVPFVTGGVGSAIMKGETETSWNFGAGTALFLSKRNAMRWEVRDYVFKSGSDSSRRTNHNIEFTLGTTLLF